MFLNVTLSGAQGQAQTYQHTILDRIGFAARQGQQPVTISADASGGPALSELDITTIAVLPGLQDRAVTVPLSDAITALQQQTTAVAAQLPGVNAATPTPSQLQVLEQASAFDQDMLILATRSDSIRYAALSDSDRSQLAAAYSVIAYSDTPRLVFTSTQFGANNQTETLSIGMDVQSDHVRVIPFPGQAMSATIAFNVARGLDGSIAEEAVTTPGGSSANGSAPVGTADIFSAAALQGITTMSISVGNLSALSALQISDEAKARITNAVASGLIVITPVQEVLLNGTPEIGWYQFDPQTGETAAVSENGTHDFFDNIGAYLSEEYIKKFTSAPIATVSGILAGGIVGFSILFPASLADGMRAIAVSHMTTGRRSSRNIKKIF